MVVGWRWDGGGMALKAAACTSASAMLEDSRRGSDSTGGQWRTHTAADGAE